MAHALVPLKDLVAATTRLAGLLRPAERRALAQAMAEDVLGALQRHASITAVTLVSDDPGAAMLARQYAAHYWSEAELGCSGLNPVIDAACRRLVGNGEELLLVLHADLPFLSAGDITAVLGKLGNTAGLVIGCDRTGEGTNLLAFSRDAIPGFRFGRNSFAAHLAWARSAGVPCRVVDRPGIGLDIDEPGDLRELLGDTLPGAAAHTRRFLAGPGLAARIRLALDSLSAGAGSEENASGTNGESMA